jgi:NADH:ubiquinone oxidoreductase subunit 6 (subunit J)
MQNENPSVAIVVTLVVVLVFLGAIALLYWAARHLSLRVFWQPPAPEERPVNQPTPAWLWLLLLAGFAAIFWFRACKKITW